MTEFCQVQNSLYVQVLRSPILATLLHGTRAAAVSQTCGVVQGMELLNFLRRHHPYSAGRPSRWASAHILVFIRSIALPVTHCHSVKATHMNSPCCLVIAVLITMSNLVVETLRYVDTCSVGDRFTVFQDVENNDVKTFRHERRHVQTNCEAVDRLASCNRSPPFYSVNLSINQYSFNDRHVKTQADICITRNVGQCPT